MRTPILIRLIRLALVALVTLVPKLQFGNETDVATALAKPGVIFVSPDSCGKELYELNP